MYFRTLLLGFSRRAGETADRRKDIDHNKGHAANLKLETKLTARNFLRPSVSAEVPSIASVIIM